MTRTLYGIDLSPPYRAVLMTAKTIGVDVEIKNLKLDGDHQSEGFKKMNPQCTVPTLDDNGFVIWDSHATMTYLMNKYAKSSSLYPEDPQKRGIVDLRLHFDTGVCFPALINVAKPIRLGETKTIPEEKKQAAYKAYDFLEKFLEKTTWVAGEEPTIADISLLTTVSTLEYFFPNDKYPKIRAWLKKCESLPHYNVNKTGLEEFITHFDTIYKK